MAVWGAQSLIGQGKFDLEDWRHLTEKLLEIDANSSDAPTPGAIVATLPIVLFSHEYKAKLRQNLEQVVSIWQDEPELRDGALAVGYAIAQCLREKLNRATLIPKTLAFLGDFQTPLVQQLEQVQILLEENAGLELAHAQLCRNAQPQSTPIALGFYCFLSTLEDFRLSIARAARSGYQPPITCAITGALSGAYNSTVGIPAGWRLSWNQPKWGITSDAQLFQLADNLLAVWSGVYDASTAIQVQQMSAVAAPRVIQPR
jgi:ADP-ribosylglycohydrolase